MRLALYPGSFDPITNGHINLIERGLKIFDKLIVSIAVNVNKEGLFTPQKRVELIQKSIGYNPKIEITIFDGLLVEYAKKSGADVILRGLRALSDFEFEFQMTHMNRYLEKKIETLFMMTSPEYFYVSSQLIREVASFGGSVKGLVPQIVEEHLQNHFSKKK